MEILFIFIVTRTFINSLASGAPEITETFLAVENPAAPRELLALDGSHRIAAKDCTDEMIPAGSMSREAAEFIHASNPNA